ncbi:acid protease [Favolaschia claudopus]|uniref:Acid protease n=1 Tax=Favolaschia claudopus TaxID=2862362 RepID=A0AAW0A091_9AGAR
MADSKLIGKALFPSRHYEGYPPAELADASRCNRLHLQIQKSRPSTFEGHSAVVERANARYGGFSHAELSSQAMERRSSSQDIQIINEFTGGFYHSYYVELNIGSPLTPIRPQPLKLILDSATPDLWVAGSPCSGCPSGLPLYDHSKSSSAVNTSTPSTLSLLIGDVRGFLFNETIRLGNYSVSEQTFLVGTTIPSIALSGGLSGILGLAFPGLSDFGNVTPFWQAILSTNATATPEMGFWLSRSTGTDNMKTEEPGGVFTFGGVNTSLYSGEIEFLDLTGPSSSFWSLEVSGQAINITSSTKLAAFDVGAMSIGGPPDDVRAIWAAVPGSSAVASPTCNTELNVSVSFGGRTWRISPSDLNLETLSGTQNLCLGAIFALENFNASRPYWFFGISFLKNVYTVFRQSPPSVGFAELSTIAGGSYSKPTPPITSSSTSSKRKIIVGLLGGLAFLGLLILLRLLFLRHQRKLKSRPEALNALITPLTLGDASPQFSVLPFVVKGPSSMHANINPTSPTLRSKRDRVLMHNYENRQTLNLGVGLNLDTQSRARRAVSVSAPTRMSDPVLVELQNFREEMRRLVSSSQNHGGEEAAVAPRAMMSTRDDNYEYGI